MNIYLVRIKHTSYKKIEVGINGGICVVGPINSNDDVAKLGWLKQYRPVACAEEIPYTIVLVQLLSL